MNTDDRQKKVVEQNYEKNHQNMTYDFVLSQEKKWLNSDTFPRKRYYSIWEIIELLDHFIDESDPDLDIPNFIHDFQTAESIRKEYPEEEYDWFHLVGLLHDLGKIMSIWGDPQWSVVGDTYPVGCAYSPKIIKSHLFIDNPDFYNPIYSTKYGIYEPRCGLEEIKMSWGHDEYMYHILKKNGCTIPKKGLDIIRYHSFYAWHKEGDYMYLMAPHDRKTLAWVKRFNKHDLYSKSNNIPDLGEIKPYYESLLKKYNIDGKLKW
jgi:inositol oxygenase